MMPHAVISSLMRRQLIPAFTHTIDTTQLLPDHEID